MAAFRAIKSRRGPLPFRYVLLLSFVFFILSTAAGLWIVNKGIQPTLMRYAESQTRKIAPMVISKAVREVIPNVKDIKEITQTEPDGAGGTITQYDVEIINHIMMEMASQVQKNLKAAELGDLEALTADVEFDEERTNQGEGIVYSVPLGQATKNALLGNLGPRVPVRFTAIGDVQTNVKSEVESSGINNMFINVSIHIEVNVQIIIPFATEITNVEHDIVVAMGYLRGQVPQFYGGNSETGPSLQLPTNP